LPASAEPANAKIPRTSTHVPVSRNFIAPPSPQLTLVRKGCLSSERAADWPPSH
jgi:hypothetical protein